MRIDCPCKTGPTYVFSCHADKTIQLVVDIMVIQLLDKVTKVRCVWVSISKKSDKSCQMLNNNDSMHTKN